MADLILIVSAVVIAIALLVKIFVTAYNAWKNRAIEAELIPSNASKSAATVSLGPYIDIVSRQFPEVLNK